MTREEIIAALREKGIRVDEWVGVDGKELTPGNPENVKGLVRRLEFLLRSQIASDKQKLDEAHAALNRIKHGGGG